MNFSTLALFVICRGIWLISSMIFYCKYSIASVLSLYIFLLDTPISRSRKVINQKSLCRLGYIATRGSQKDQTFLSEEVHCVFRSMECQYLGRCFSFQRSNIVESQRGYFSSNKKERHALLLTNDITNFLRQSFPCHLISPRSEILWSVSLCDFSLCGYLKERVRIRKKTRTLEYLKKEIIE